MEACSAIEHYKKMLGKTAHELREEGDLKLAANDKKILKYMRASLENCERIRQGFFYWDENVTECLIILRSILIARNQQTLVKNSKKTHYLKCV